MVAAYDEGVRFFRDGLGFEVVEDTDVGQSKWWIVVAPPGGRGAMLILAVPADRRQRARIGDQTGGRVGYFLLTNDFLADYEVLRSRASDFLRSRGASATVGWRSSSTVGRQVGLARTGRGSWRCRMSFAR
jgi:catechol 2,3-dioxygenase-like lactoylglutathione lyase family enzyme